MREFLIYISLIFYIIPIENSNLSIYKTNNNFKIIVPYCPLNKHILADDEKKIFFYENYLIYLPNNIKQEDLKQIFNFMMDNNNISHKDYILKFSIEVDGINLEKINFDKFDKSHQTNNQKNNEVITKTTNIFGINKNKKISIDKNNDLIYIRILDKKYWDKLDLSSSIIKVIDNILKKIHIHLQKKQININNLSYKILLTQNTIIAIEVSGDFYKEKFFIVNTPKNSMQLVVNQNFELVPEIIINNKPLTVINLGSKFGIRRDPFCKMFRFHSGQDFKAPMNTSILNVMDGVVVDKGHNRGYGWFVLINHGDGYSSLYAHLNKIHIRIGDIVSKNQIIGLSGASGRSTGPHLHFELIYNGLRINPIKKHRKKQKITKIFEPIIQNIINYANEIFNKNENLL
jgi:murein DD-endopeptidase MepM/ murein hydrolase activator NlpD